MMIIILSLNKLYKFSDEYKRRGDSENRRLLPLRVLTIWNSCICCSGMGGMKSVPLWGILCLHQILNWQNSGYVRFPDMSVSSLLHSAYTCCLLSNGYRELFPRATPWSWLSSAETEAIPPSQRTSSRIDTYIKPRNNRFHSNSNSLSLLTRWTVAHDNIYLHLRYSQSMRQIKSE
jgi:hypothetical protein